MLCVHYQRMKRLSVKRPWQKPNSAGKLRVQGLRMRVRLREDAAKNVYTTLVFRYYPECWSCLEWGVLLAQSRFAFVKDGTLEMWEA